VDALEVFENPRTGVEAGGEVLELLVECNRTPDGVVTVMISDDCASVPTSMRYPTGRSLLNLWIREG